MVPPGPTPRDFGLVGLVVLAAVVAAALVLLGTTPRPSMGEPDYVGETYWGARLLPKSPGRGGLPVIPARVDETGQVVGEPRHLDWYAYCGQPAPGLHATYGGSNAFRYYTTPDRLAQMSREGLRPWYESKLGQPVAADDFTRIGQGAPVQWRSDNEKGLAVLRGILLRVDPDEYPAHIRTGFAPDGFLAFFSGSTNFCCTVGYEETTNPLARMDGRPLLFDTCHDQRFDPKAIVAYPMPPGPI